MKAINTLKNHILSLEKMVLVFDEYAMYKSRDESKKAVQELNQVIKELEDLKNRSCATCKYDRDIQCFDTGADIQDFYCSNWESKNERD